MSPRDDFAERLAVRLDSYADRADRTDAPDPGACDAGAVDAGAVNAGVDAIVEELRSPAMWSEPPASLRASILSQITAEAATPRSVDAPEPVSTPEKISTPGKAKVPWWRDGRTGRLRGWVVIPAAALAAAAFTAVVLVVDRTVLSDLRPRESYTVAGTSLAPQAVLTARVADTPSGFSIWLRASGLPAAAPGSYYAAWLVGPKGTVALGSFHQRATGDRIELWSGVDPQDYPTFMITLQAEGGPPGPSSLIVATGPLHR